MAVYKQWMFIVGVGLLAFTVDVYWSLVTVGVLMCILGPLTDYPPPRGDYTLTFPQIMHLLHHPSEGIDFLCARVSIEHSAMSRFKDCFREPNDE
ncbi:MAG: hypothetical protein U9N61_03980, partial [Euryarchaeota archaeon]|nr:hypothetical protein [Euryarchaeota archaeon]